MKKVSLLLAGLVGLLLFSLATPAFAKGKEKTITGEAKCAKCALKESSKCQTVIQMEGKHGKLITYYLVNNEVAKSFHEKICSSPMKVTAFGTVKKVHGKYELDATKIEPAS